MNIFTLLAHTGHDHEEEVVQHATSAGFSLTDPLILWLMLLLGVCIVVILGQVILKWQLSTTLLVLSAFLIVFSIFSYQNPGIYSVVALSTGFAMVLFLAIVGLSGKK